MTADRKSDSPTDMYLDVRSKWVGEADKDLIERVKTFDSKDDKSDILNLE